MILQIILDDIKRKSNDSIFSLVDKYRMNPFTVNFMRYFENVPSATPVSPLHFFRRPPANFLNSS